jgi:hypothetical protein
MACGGILIELLMKVKGQAEGDVSLGAYRKKNRFGMDFFFLRLISAEERK